MKRNFGRLIDLLLNNVPKEDLPLIRRTHPKIQPWLFGYNAYAEVEKIGLS